MKKKVYYKLNRYKVAKVEVESVEQEQAVKILNRETDRFAKSEDTYYEKCSSLDEMYEETGFEPADDTPSPEEQFFENEREKAIKQLVSKAMQELTEKQRIVVYKTFWGEKTLRQVGLELGIDNKTVYEILEAAKEKMKKFLKFFEKHPRKTLLTFQ